MAIKPVDQEAIDDLANEISDLSLERLPNSPQLTNLQRKLVTLQNIKQNSKSHNEPLVESFWRLDGSNIGVLEFQWPLNADGVHPSFTSDISTLDGLEKCDNESLLVNLVRFYDLDEVFDRFYGVSFEEKQKSLGLNNLKSLKLFIRVYIWGTSIYNYF